MSQWQSFASRHQSRYWAILDEEAMTRMRSNVIGSVSDDKPIYVTEPYLPPLEEFIPYLEKIWATKKLTNSGPFHVELEYALRKFLGVEHIALFTNGTIALVTALQA